MAQLIKCIFPHTKEKYPRNLFIRWERWTITEFVFFTFLSFLFSVIIVYQTIWKLLITIFDSVRFILCRPLNFDYGKLYNFPTTSESTSLQFCPLLQCLQLITHNKQPFSLKQQFYFHLASSYVYVSEMDGMKNKMENEKFFAQRKILIKLGKLFSFFSIS